MKISRVRTQKLVFVALPVIIFLGVMIAIFFSFSKVNYVRGDAMGGVKYSEKKV